MELEKIQEVIESKFNDLKNEVKSSADKGADEVKSLNDKIEALQSDLDEAKAKGLDMEKLQDQVDSLDMKLNKKGSFEAKSQSLEQELETKFNDAKVTAAISELKNNRSASANIELKAVGTILRANYAGSVLTTYVDPNISGAPKNVPFFRNIVNVFQLKGDKVTWVNRIAGEGGAGMTAEGALKSQMDWDYVEESASVRKITAYVKASKEALDDMYFLRNEINTELVDAIQLKLDEQISNGNGTAPNLKGILQYAPTFAVTGTSFNASVDNANRLDVLRVAIALVARNKFRANYVAINPMDAALMDLTKGEDGHYVMPPFVTADGVRVAGVPVLESFSIAEGSFLVGDFTKSNLGIREEINVNIGYENDDFTKNLVTILAEMRAVHYIKDHQKTAFVQGTFAAAITAINKPVV